MKQNGKDATQQMREYSEMRKKHVRWTENEKDLLVQEILKISSSEKLLYRLEQAQQKLPAERRREITTLSLVPWLKNMVLQKQKDQQQGIQPQPQVSQEDFSSKDQDFLTERVLLFCKKYPKMSAIQLLRIAQLKLPHEEHRKLADDHDISWLLDRLSSYSEDKLSPGLLKSVKENPPLQLPEIPEPPKPQAPKQFEEFDMETFAEKIASKIADEFFLRIQGYIDESVKNTVSANLHEEEKSSEEKKKIVICNLLPNQQNEIISEYGDIFDLRFWGDGENSFSTLKSLCSTVDQIFAMTDKMQHRVDKAITGVNKNAYTRVPGGMTSLKKALTNYFVEAV